MKIGFIFPGYGSQFVGMGKELYDLSRTVQEYFEEAAQCLDRNFVKLCFASSDAEISKLENALLANFLVSSSIYKLVQEQVEIKPDVVAGYGLGGFSALFAAGGINFPDGLYLINKYVSFYKEYLSQIDFKVLSILDGNKEILEDIFKRHDQDAYISSYVTDTEFIVICKSDMYESIKKDLDDAGIKKIKDRENIVGLYSSLMDPVSQGLAIYSEKVDFKDLQIPLIKNSTAKYMTKKDEVKGAMLQHMTSPLKWYDCLKALHDCDLIVEIGPGTVLQKQVKQVYPDKKVISINKQADIDELKDIVQPVSQSSEQVIQEKE